MAFGRLIQGLAGNFSEQSKEALTKEFGQYLLENEEIQSGYKLIRDSIIFTNIRIIFTDKQGTTGRMKKFKADINSFVIQLSLLISVSSLQINRVQPGVRCLLNQFSS